MTRSEQDEYLALAVMEHLGMPALTGRKMTILEAFEKGWHAALALPADAEPVGLVRAVMGGFSRTANIQCLQDLKVGTLLYASPPSPDRTQGEMPELEKAVDRLIRHAWMLGDSCCVDDLDFVDTFTHGRGDSHISWLRDQVSESKRAVMSAATPQAARHEAAQVAAQADALAALKELVACKDLQWEMRLHKDYVHPHWNAAWAEARRVIAATGEKHE